MLELSLIIVALFVLTVASYVDLRILEVPDWINYAGIAAGLGIHLIFSLQQWNYWPFVSSLIGFGIAFTIACLMFYTAQWGGGDAKLLMALGAIIGFQPEKFGFGSSFLINLVFVGGAWGMLWSVQLAARNWKEFWKTFRTLMHQQPYARMRISAMLSTAILVVAALVFLQYQLELIGLALVTYFICYSIIFIKSVEISCMHRWVKPDKLTEGDWLVKPIKIGKTTINPPKLGLEKEHIAFIQMAYKQKKIDKVLVRYGVPFAPAFLLAFLATWAFGNVIFAALF
ncbi:MAG: A24 family peptidase [Candidatus Woesearchaeota archaeon]